MNYKLWFVFALQLMLAGCGTIKTHIPDRNGDYGAFKNPKAQKVVLVVLENTDQSLAANQNFLGELKRKGAYFSNYYAVAHPSQPNYIAIFPGSVAGVNGDKIPQPIDRPHLGSEGMLKSWKVFAEGYKVSTCPPKKEVHASPFKHIPALSFKDVQESSKLCANIVGFDEFPKEAKLLPSFSLVIPNLNHDAHDHSLWDADDWLKEHFATLLENPDFKRDVIFIVTFDENGTSFLRYKLDQNNRVYTVMLGDDIQAGEYSAVYNHYDLLRTIEEIFGLKPMAEGDSAARAIGGIWK
jgi:acid phosphatase